MIDVPIFNPTVLSLVFIIVLLLRTVQYAVYKHCSSLTSKSLGKKLRADIPAEKIEFDDYEAQTDKASQASHRQNLIGTRNNVSGISNVTNLEVRDKDGEKGSYTGSVSLETGMPDGVGRLDYERAANCWYEGDWKHGYWNGHGRISNGDGDFYEGGVKNNRKHGHGMMIFSDGREFVGKYVNGEMVNGRMMYSDGSSYDGSWKEGLRHGFGKFVFIDDGVYEGEFRNGEFHGFGKMIWNNGGWYKGEWKNGEIHKRGIEISSNGSVRHYGEWINGCPKIQNKLTKLMKQ